MRTRILCLSIFALIGQLISGCGYYHQDIIFRIKSDADRAFIKEKMDEAEKNYRVHFNDQIEFAVFTNKGELLIDPNSELARQLAGAASGGGGGGGQGVARPKFLVMPNGNAYLPMLGATKVEGFTMRELDSSLGVAYSQFYQDVFVVSKVANRRAFLLSPLSTGAGVGGLGGKIVTLENDNTSLIEVLTGAGGIAGFAKMDRIRLIRGDLSNPQVYVISLRYMHDLPRYNLTIRPNDIIYIEPGRRPVFNVLTDVTNILGFVTSTSFLVLTLIALNNR
jgi:polysaccharide biosynthesis/export protein